MSRKIPYKDIMNRIKDDVDYIADEAYTKGYTDGRKQAKTQAELDVAHDIENVAKENYQKGLDDAWECAKKINCLPRDGGLSGIELDDIFNMDSNCAIMKDFSASEALEKIRAYEDEHKIRVGDEVIIASEKCVVLRVTKDGCLDRWMNLYGQTYANNTGYANNEIKKTGKHYDQIAEVLEKMRGEE